MGRDRDKGYSSDSRRRRSRFDREPSPKRLRRDAKPDAEKAHNVPRANSVELVEKHGRQLQNSSPREPPLISDRKADGSALDKDSNEKTHKSSDETKVHSNPTEVPRSKKTHKSSDETKVHSNPTEVPRSRSYFQHDKRGTASHGGRSSRLRGNAERGWWKDSRDHGSERATDRELQQREEMPKKGDGIDRKVWGHDGFFEMEANPPPPPPPPPNQKRPAFREQKITADNIENDRNGKNEYLKPRNKGNQVSNVERRGERGGRHERYPDRFEKSSPRGGERSYRRDERQSGAYGSRDRRGGGNGRFVVREPNSGQQQPLHSDGGRVEKWKHDLYDEANKSPPPKNEEDRLAKIEALLAS